MPRRIRRGIELSRLTIDGERAVRNSLLRLDHTRKLHRMAVSNSRIFYLSTERERPLPEWTEPGLREELTSLLLESINIESGSLAPLPAQELRRIPRNSFSYCVWNHFGRLTSEQEQNALHDAWAVIIEPTWAALLETARDDFSGVTTSPKGRSALVPSRSPPGATTSQTQGGSRVVVRGRRRQRGKSRTSAEIALPLAGWARLGMNDRSDAL